MAVAFRLHYATPEATHNARDTELAPLDTSAIRNDDDELDASAGTEHGENGENGTAIAIASAKMREEEMKRAVTSLRMRLIKALGSAIGEAQQAEQSGQEGESGSSSRVA